MLKWYSLCSEVCFHQSLNNLEIVIWFKLFKSFIKKLCELYISKTGYWCYIKDIGEINRLCFTSLSYLIYLTLCYQILFTASRYSKYFSRYKRSKPDSSIGSLWKAQTKTANNSVSLKIYLLLLFSIYLLQIFRKSSFHC